MKTYNPHLITIYFIEFNENQTQSNDFSEDEIVEQSKIAQLGQFNDISNGNTSTIFYGGIIFPPDFDYDDQESRTCTSDKCRNMKYTIRFGVNYVNYETDSLYTTGAGPSDSGTKKVKVKINRRREPKMLKFEVKILEKFACNIFANF